MHWALGDAGAALEAGKDLRPAQFPTVESERRARLGTDMARAWWVWRRPEQTARALLGAYRARPGEVRDPQRRHRTGRPASAHHRVYPGVEGTVRRSDRVHRRQAS
ncbi:hypothetical protein GCM10009574_091870 [Streptomyces asiaticus]|uniref:Uncharacterized protein n=2 Tax=Streptomyces rhizosphaericus TaxID=114699 RepID=A0ABP4BRI9_9ACTN